MKAAADDKDAQRPSIAAPEAYKKDTKWRVWKEQFLNYMGSKYGQNKAHLSYILRSEDDPADEEDIEDNDFERMIYLTPHEGITFQYDNGMVYGELKALLINSTAFTWMHIYDQARNGRAAWKALVQHYEGPTEQNKVIEAAYNTICNATYQGERRNWTFESYYQAHQEAHYDLDLYGEVVTENKKVTDFLRGISDPTCNVAKGIVLATPEYLNDFTKAVLYIASMLNVTLINQNQSQRRNISNVNTKNRGKGKGHKKLTRSYSPAEWRALSNEEREKVLDAHAKAKTERESKKGDKDAPNTGGKRIAAAVTTGNGDTDSDEINVHAGNILEVLRQKNIPCAPPADAGDHMSSRRNKLSRINMISSRCFYPPPQRYISRTKRNWPKNWNDGITYERNELDSRADTCCLGSTYRVLEYTGRICEVHPYHPKYKPTQNVPVVKGVTAYDDKITGKTFIICINQGLYFGNEMKHSLLNQNQIRSNGVVVNDCPFHLSPNKTSSHSLYFPDDDVRIQLELHGCMSHFVTRYPTEAEIKSCQWLELTSDEEWDPYFPKFNDEEEKSMNYKNIYSISTNNKWSLFSDNDLRFISSTFSLKETIEHPFIWRKCDAISTNRNLNQKAQELADKWGLSFNTTQQTLKSTTKNFIRSALNPIEKRYRTAIQQLRYQQLRSEHGRFYSDTMFAIKRSIN
jgi:hypothetical protein